jgi:ABC-type branched-subunit amino acid transport system substrate-binding protein
MPFSPGPPMGASAVAMLTALILAGAACAQSGEPIKIGYSMSLTGGLAPNGKSALLAQHIWEEDTNAKGGMLGRPVKLIYYDDKSSPSEISPIYTKLLDIDKVDLIIGAYGTALTAPAMPIVIQRKKTLIGLLALAVNFQFNYPNYFVMIPSGPEAKPAFTRGFFDVAVRQDPKPRTVAIVAADQEFSRNAADGARENMKQSGLTLVYERTYPPATADFAPIVRAIAAANPDLVVVCSYPPDSVGMVRAVNELGFKPKAIGGASCSRRPSRPSLDRCSTVSSTTSSGCPWRRCNSPQWPISFRVIRPGRNQKGSIRWDITCRLGPTLSFRSCNRQWRRRRRSMMPSSGITSARTRSPQWWERSGSAQRVNGRTHEFFRFNIRT